MTLVSYTEGWYVLLAQVEIWHSITKMFYFKIN